MTGRRKPIRFVVVDNDHRYGTEEAGDIHEGQTFALICRAEPKFQLHEVTAGRTPTLTLQERYEWRKGLTAERLKALYAIVISDPSMEREVYDHIVELEAEHNRYVAEVERPERVQLPLQPLP